MGRYVVWECDKCHKQEVGEDKPAAWFQAVVYKDNPDAIPSHKKVWCDSCWALIEAPNPLNSSRGFKGTT